MTDLNVLRAKKAADKNPQVWRVHPKYQHIVVSVDGRVAAFLDDNPKPVPLKPNWVGDTKVVTIIKGEKVRCLHLMVADAWVPNPRGYSMAMFRDGDRSNNHADNIVWGYPKRGSTKYSPRLKHGKTPDEHRQWELELAMKYVEKHADTCRLYPKNKRYIIHREGMIYAYRNGKLKELALDKNANGTLSVHLHTTSVPMNKIVAETWLPQPEGTCRVLYKDGNRANLSVDNLEWGTTDQMIDANLRAGYYTEAYRPPTPVRNLKTGIRYPSMSAAARADGVSASTIKNHIRDLVSPAYKMYEKDFEHLKGLK